MKEEIHYVISFELPTVETSVVEYRYNPQAGSTEIWCTVYHRLNGRLHIGDSTFIETLDWVAMNESGVHWREEARIHFADHYAARPWSSQSATDTALGYSPSGYQL
jgi:hypothetical protein